MAKELETGEELTERHSLGRFIDRYPNFPSWLNGNTWELDYTTDIGIDIRAFRAGLRYQARALRLNLTTKTVVRHYPDGTGAKVLLVRAS
jgi:hypothetical protein